MLRTNLSSRPFYNERAARMALGALVLVVIAITGWNVARGLSLAATQRTLGAHALEAEREAQRLQQEAAAMRAQVNPVDLDQVATAAREANGIIDQRAFSWTALFSQFEVTLPPDVRVTSVEPELQRDGTFTVGVSVEARRVEDLDAFLEALESRGTFRNVLSQSEQATDDGLIEARVVGTYVGGASEQGAGSSKP
jgi:hypothetical protein